VPNNCASIKKMWYIFTMEYYSAIKKNEIMSFAGKWMEVEIILNEISQVQKGNITYFHSNAESRSEMIKTMIMGLECKSDTVGGGSIGEGGKMERILGG
jgi:hypothetical protein